MKNEIMTHEDVLSAAAKRKNAQSKPIEVILCLLFVRTALHPYRNHDIEERKLGQVIINK